MARRLSGQGRRVAPRGARVHRRRRPRPRPRARRGGRCGARWPAAGMLADVGLLSDADRKAIHAGLVQVLAEHRAGRFRISAEEEDVHTAVEGRLTERPARPGAACRAAGRSRNDQVLLDVRLFLRRRLLEVALAGVGVARALLEVAREHEAVVMPGYTHPAPGRPLVRRAVGRGPRRCVGHRAPRRPRRRRVPARERGRVGRPRSPLDRQQTAALLGFARLQVNAQAVQSSRGKAGAGALRGHPARQRPGQAGLGPPGCRIASRAGLLQARPDTATR